MATTAPIESGIVLKQGDTFYYSFPVTDDDANPVTGLEGNFKSQVYDRAGSGRTKYGDLTITESETVSGTYELRSGVTDGVQDTQEWPVSKPVFDIQYTEGTIVKSTSTLKFEIVGDVTV